MMNISKAAAYCPSSDNLDTSITLSLIKDRVLPSIEEIYFCVRKQLVAKNEQILFKMMLDYHEALFNSNIYSAVKAYEVLVPCALKFYKTLTSQEIDDLLVKM